MIFSPNSNELTKALTNYTNKYLSVTNDPNQALKYLLQFSVFIDQHGYEINPDILAELINSNLILSNILHLVIEKNYEKMLKVKLTELFPMSTTCDLIENYCMSNGIEIFVNDSFSLDTLERYHSEWNYFKEAGTIKRLTHEEEKTLAVESLSGSEMARNKLIEANLLLVPYFAKKYVGLGLSLNDLIQEGNLGLIEAATRFDPKKGTTFSSYASIWIKQSIKKALTEQSQSIKYPGPIYWRLLSYHKVCDEFVQKYDRIPTNEELSYLMNVAKSEITAIKKTDIKVDNIDEIIKNINTPSDYENKDKITTLETYLIDETQNIEETIISKSLVYEVQKLLKKCHLTGNQMMTICLRYGIDKSRPMELHEIAQKLNLSHARVSQIELSAIKKLRYLSTIKEYAIYMDNYHQAVNFIDYSREKYIEYQLTNRQVKIKKNK